MMIVDLIDEVDFKEKMLGIGAPVMDCQTLPDVAETLTAWLDKAPEQWPSVKSACHELEATGATILPEVHAVIKSLLQRSQ